MSVRTNSDLIRDALNEASAASYTVLVERYERLVWTVAWRVLHDYHATQDVTQETFLIAHKRLHEVRKPDAIGSWLSMIARREAQRVRLQRTEQQRTEQQRTSAESIPLVDIASRQPAPELDEEYRLLLDAIGRLPDHERDVMALRYLNGHSVSEVAQLLNRPLGTVTKQLSRCVKRLQAEFRTTPTSTTHSNKPAANHHA